MMTYPHERLCHMMIYESSSLSKCIYNVCPLLPHAINSSNMQQRAHFFLLLRVELNHTWGCVLWWYKSASAGIYYSHSLSNGISARSLLSSCAGQERAPLRVIMRISLTHVSLILSCFFRYQIKKKQTNEKQQKTTKNTIAHSKCMYNTISKNNSQIY